MMKFSNGTLCHVICQGQILKSVCICLNDQGQCNGLHVFMCCTCQETNVNTVSLDSGDLPVACKNISATVKMSTTARHDHLIPHVHIHTHIHTHTEVAMREIKTRLVTSRGAPLPLPLPPRHQSHWGHDQMSWWLENHPETSHSQSLSKSVSALQCPVSHTGVTLGDEASHKTARHM